MLQPAQTDDGDVIGVAQGSLEPRRTGCAALVAGIHNDHPGYRVPLLQQDHHGAALGRAVGVNVYAGALEGETHLGARIVGLRIAPVQVGIVLIDLVITVIEGIFVLHIADQSGLLGAAPALKVGCGGPAIRIGCEALLIIHGRGG